MTLLRTLWASAVEVFSHQVWWFFSTTLKTAWKEFANQNLKHFPSVPCKRLAAVADRCLHGLFHGAPINGRKELALPGAYGDFFSRPKTVDGAL